MNKRALVTDRLPSQTLENWVDDLSVAEQRVIHAERRARLLEEGPGGIMEMKQTIADLERYREFVYAFLDEPMEPSWEKVPVQYRNWKHMAEDLVKDIEKK